MVRTASSRPATPGCDPTVTSNLCTQRLQAMFEAFSVSDGFSWVLLRRQDLPRKRARFLIHAVCCMPRCTSEGYVFCHRGRRTRDRIRHDSPPQSGRLGDHLSVCSNALLPPTGLTCHCVSGVPPLRFRVWLCVRQLGVFLFYHLTKRPACTSRVAAQFHFCPDYLNVRCACQVPKYLGPQV